MKFMSRLSLKAAAATLGLVVLQPAAMLVTAQFSPVRAELVRFWEDDADKPSVTGRASKSASHKRAKPSAASDDSDDAPVARKKKRVRVASLGDDNYEPRPSRKSLSGGGGSVSWVASPGCLNGTLIGIVQEVAASYGGVTVSSTCRDHGHNASVGGAKHSQHLTGDAVDFRVHGNVSGAIAFLNNNGSVGGFHHYGGGLFHIDTGPSRRW